MDEFKYESLNLEKPAIRLLSLNPGNDDTMISCKLFQAELHDRENMISYEALSYTWGSPFLSEKIHVNGCCLKITHNLYRALLSLRHQDRERVLWIDAVCIDQENDKERGHQVGQMGNIYKEADRVIFRLSSGSYTTDILMEGLQQLQKESIQHAYRAWSRDDSHWKDLWTSTRPSLEEHDRCLAELQRRGLQEILEQPWFHRVWILQEVAFAKAGIISCGTKSVSARIFALAPLLLGITPDAHCQSVLDIMPSPWRQSTWWSESRSFYKLLLNFGSSEATDPRDLVYALRGMSSDLANKYDDPLFPDYKKSQEKLVHDVIKYIYDFNMSDFNVAPRLSSIRELATYLPKLETDIFRHLTEMSRSDHMERILRTPEILVSQDMIKAAAQYDKDGMVVNVLLRCRGGEFSIDETILLCAAANLNAAKEVFEAFWSHQNQIAITENVILATLKNSESGHSAMCFLLSLKTQDYRVAPILEAIPRIASRDSRRKIIRMLGQKNYSNDTIPEVLTAAAEIQDSDLQAEFIKTLLQQTDFRNDTTQRVLTAAAKIQDFDLQTEIIKTFLQQTDFSNDTIQQVLTAAFKVQDFDLQTEIIKTFLQRTDFRNDTVLDVLAVAANISNYHPKIKNDLQIGMIESLREQKDCWDDTIPDILDTVAETQNYDLRTYFIKRLLQKKGSSNNITSEIITAAAQIRDENLLPEIVRILVEQKGTSNDTIFELFAAGSTAGLSKFELFVIEKEFFKAKEIEEEILQEKRRQIRKVHAKLY